MEYDERIYNKAIENKEKAISAGRVAFKAENAEYFSVPREVDEFTSLTHFHLKFCKSDTQDTRILLRKTKRDKTTVLLSVR